MSRLLVVCRHLWPVCNEAAYRLASLVRFLREQSIPTEVVTTRWHSKWPATSTFYEFPMTRILPAPTSPWSEGFFHRNLWNWIERHSDHFDTCYIDSLNLIANTKLSTPFKQKQFLIRLDAYSPMDLDLLRRPSATLAWLATSPTTKFLVQNASENRMLIGAGVSAANIVRLDPIAVSAKQKTSRSKFQAREFLKLMNADFLVPEHAPLVLVFMTGDDYECEHQLMRTMAREVEADQCYRAWIFGSNDLVRRHYTYLKDRGVHHDLLLHCPFDDLDLLYDAADLVICPQNRVGKSHFYPLAFSTGTPTLLPSFNSAESMAENVPSLGEYTYNVLAAEVDLPERFGEFLAAPVAFEQATERSHKQVDWDRLRKKHQETWQSLVTN